MNCNTVETSPALTAHIITVYLSFSPNAGPRFFNHQVSGSAGSTDMLISQTVNNTSVDTTGCVKANICCPDPHSCTNRWISRAYLEIQAAHLAP